MLGTKGFPLCIGNQDLLARLLAFKINYYPYQIKENLKLLFSILGNGILFLYTPLASFPRGERARDEADALQLRSRREPADGAR